MWNKVKAFLTEYKWLIIGEVVFLFLMWLDVTVLFQDQVFVIKMAKIIGICCMILFAITYLFYRKREEGDGKRLRLNIHQLFLIVGGILGLLYMFLIPVYHTPDEREDYLLAYQLSNAMMGIEAEDDSHIPMRNEDATLYTDYSFENMHEYDMYYVKMMYVKRVMDPEMTQYEYEATLVQQSYPYYPAALMITISRLIGCSAILTFLAARFINLVLFVILYAYAIYKIPIGKLGLFGMGILPIVSQQAFAIKPDYMVMACSAILIATFLDFWYGEKQATAESIDAGDAVSGAGTEKYASKKSNWREIVEWILMIFSGILILPVKNYSYFLICFLPLVLAVKFWKKNRNLAIKALGATAIIVIGAVLLQKFSFHIGSETAVTGSIFGPHMIDWAGVEGWDMETLLHETFASERKVLFLIFSRTFLMYAGDYWMQLIGLSLGNYDVNVPSFCIFVWILLFAILFLKRKDDAVVLGKKMKLFMGAVSLIVILIVLSGMLLGWTPQNYEFIVGVQGRYFLPIIPFLMLSLQTNVIQIDKKYDKAILTFAIWHAAFTLIAVLSLLNLPKDAGLFG